ncbi:MCP four helix bundle domain-containing protein [Undibacterium arcticum]
MQGNPSIDDLRICGKKMQTNTASHISNLITRQANELSKKMKVGKRLGLGFALVLVLLIAVTALGISRMAQVQNRLEEVVNISNVESRLIIDMRAIVYDRLQSLRNLTLLNDAGDMEPEMGKIKQQSDQYAQAEGKLNKMFVGQATVPAEKNSTAGETDRTGGGGPATGGQGQGPGSGKQSGTGDGRADQEKSARCKRNGSIRWMNS